MNGSPTFACTLVHVHSSLYRYIATLGCALLISVASVGCGGAPATGGGAGSEDDTATDADDNNTGAGGNAGDTGAGGTVTSSTAEDCGDSQRSAVEACDDGNAASGDGCASNCSEVEVGYVCPNVGSVCREISCGDNFIDGNELCDDSNALSGDGCSDTCQLEPGWKCPTVGVRCSAIECGDGLVAGFEECDDNNTAPDDGCSDTCELEDGFKCSGTTCTQTICGDNAVEGTEQCDFGDVMPFDGCSPTCKWESQCSGGTCMEICGDGVLLPETAAPIEECDDGNDRNFDGCSDTCKVESGFQCIHELQPLPDTLHLPILYRDFIGHDDAIGDFAGRDGHRDFNKSGSSGSGITFGLVETELGQRGGVGPLRPLLAHNRTTVAEPYTFEEFDQWYFSGAAPTTGPTSGFAVPSTLTLDRTATDAYNFTDTTFLPLDNDGWVVANPGVNASPVEAIAANGHNYSFTTQFEYTFIYKGDEVLSFTGDDDLWVFVDDYLCLDVGGLHSPESATMSFANPNAAESNTQDAIVTSCKDRLVVGHPYTMKVYHAERHYSGSNFKLTLTGFVSRLSACQFECGDGIVTPYERCDDGVNDGGYGECAPGCQEFGGYCGDGVPNGPEQCDKGVDNGTAAGDGCTANCTTGPFCGDGIRQPELNEGCDDGPNNGKPGSICSDECKIRIE